MLQIVTGMYFEPGARIYERVHRGVYATNSWRLNADEVELPVGTFRFADSSALPTTSVTVDVTDRLPRDGGGMLATGGVEHLRDAVAVFAFALNVTCTADTSLLMRSVPVQLPGPRQGPAEILRRTFDPQILLTDEEIADARSFCTALVRLRRDHFEAAMRAIRKVVDASLLVAEDPALAYTLYVASLETLAQIATSPNDLHDWSTYNPEKRRFVDAALEGVESTTATRVREAVLAIDQLSLARRFRAFTLGYLRPSYYRGEARDVRRPIRAHDLPNALDVAYQFRSKNVHELQDLAPEVWLIAERADTSPWKDRSVLSLEGLNRLSRHVIRTFVSRAPVGIDPDFDYRQVLPGQVQMRWAPQYWVGNVSDFNLDTARRYLDGFCELLLEALRTSSSSNLASLDSVLERIEQLLASSPARTRRLPLVAIYCLWHRLFSPSHHRAGAEALQRRYLSDLDEPSSEAFAVAALSGVDHGWDDGQLVELASKRRSELARAKGQPLPNALDTALLIAAAEAASRRGDHDTACDLADAAVGSAPGDPAVLRAEELLAAGTAPAFDTQAFLAGTWNVVP